jgi:hypothetical protein
MVIKKSEKEDKNKGNIKGNIRMEWEMVREGVQEIARTLYGYKKVLRFWLKYI